jgi:transposase
MYIKHIVGIDVSKDNSTARFGSLESDLAQKIGEPLTIDNNNKGFRELLSFVKKNLGASESPVYFVMEATGIYYENLAYFLREHNQKVVVLLPNKSKNFGKTLEIKSKTDKLDSLKLTIYGLEKQMQFWELPSPTMKALKALTRERQSIKTMMVQIKNQLHAKDYSHKPLKESIQRGKQLLLTLSKQVKAIDQQIKEIIDKDPDLKDKIRKIVKIKGLGLITIVTIIAETDGFAMIRNGKQLVSYAGLDVVYNESGLKKGKTAVSKKGNKHLRTAVFMPALSAAKWNPPLKKLYVRLVIKKKVKYVALIAVARKLLLLVYTLYTKNTEYVPDYKPAYVRNIPCVLV